MTNDFTIRTICERIGALRRSTGMTQNDLAEKLGVSFQAVSKWENALSCPDVLLFPAIAKIFDVSIDYLFGIEPRETPAVKPEKGDSALPWEDDGKLRAVLFDGTRLVKKEEYQKVKTNITLQLEGDARDVISDFNVSCRNVEGNISAVTVESGNVEGNISTTRIQCGNVGGNISTVSVDCKNVTGDVKTTSIACGSIEGNVAASSLQVSGDINGDVSLAGKTLALNMESGSIHGDVTIQGENDLTTLSTGGIGGDLTIRGAAVTCQDVGGDITIVGTDNSPARLEAHSIGGDLTIRNALVTCGDVDGDTTIGSRQDSPARLEAGDIGGCFEKE